MLLAALLLIAPSHCADATWCPPLAVIENAVRQYDIDEAKTLTEELNTPESHAMITFEPEPIRRISGVYCDAPLGRMRAVTCQATAHYKQGRSTHMFRLVRTPQGWRLGEGGMSVFRLN